MAASTGVRARQPAPSPAQRAVAYRRAFLDAVTEDDVRAIGAALLERAKAGDLAAARLILDRVVGTAPAADWPSARAVEREEAFDQF